MALELEITAFSARPELAALRRQLRLGERMERAQRDAFWAAREAACALAAIHRRLEVLAGHIDCDLGSLSAAGQRHRVAAGQRLPDGDAIAAARRLLLAARGQIESARSGLRDAFAGLR